MVNVESIARLGLDDVKAQALIMAKDALLNI